MPRNSTVPVLLTIVSTIYRLQITATFSILFNTVAFGFLGIILKLFRRP